MTSMWLIGLVVAGAAFEVVCIATVLMARGVRLLPKWLWVVLCACCNPLGGLVFLVFGRQRSAELRTAT